MPSIFHSLSNYLGFNDGVLIHDLTGTVPGDTKIMRIAANGQITKMRLLNLKPNSSVIFKVNGALHTQFAVDDRGEATVQLTNPVDLARIHCPQLAFEGANSMPIIYNLL
jgi:hypothetical protein